MEYTYYVLECGVLGATAGAAKTRGRLSIGRLRQAKLGSYLTNLCVRYYCTPAFALKPISGVDSPTPGLNGLILLAERATSAKNIRLLLDEIGHWGHESVDPPASKRIDGLEIVIHGTLNDSAQLEGGKRKKEDCDGYAPGLIGNSTQRAQSEWGPPPPWPPQIGLYPRH